MKVGNNKPIHIFHPLKTFDLNNMHVFTNVALEMTTLVLVATCIICNFSII